MLLKHEKEKKQEYNGRIMNIKHDTFTSLFFSVSGVLGNKCSMFHKHMAEKIAKNFNWSYQKVITVIRCKLSFIIMRSALLCITRSRSNYVLKDIDEFSLTFDSAELWGVTWSIFLTTPLNLRAFCSLSVFRILWLNCLLCRLFGLLFTLRLIIHFQKCLIFFVVYSFGYCM